jgi:hypothetical protein
MEDPTGKSFGTILVWTNRGKIRFSILTLHFLHTGPKQYHRGTETTRFPNQLENDYSLAERNIYDVLDTLDQQDEVDQERDDEDNRPTGAPSQVTHPKLSLPNPTKNSMVTRDERSALFRCKSPPLSLQSASPRLRTGEPLHLVCFWPSPTSMARREQHLCAPGVRWWVRDGPVLCVEGVHFAANHPHYRCNRHHPVSAQANHCT